jgi:hypothetical protein
MKLEQVNAWRMAGKVAASLALSAVATAQTAGGEASLFTKKGIELTQVSLEGDIRTAEPARGKIVLQRPPSRELELVIKMHPLRNSAPGALIPALEDMESSLVLQNGTPGAVAVIHLESRAPELRRARGTRIVGFFDEDGKFEGPLPQGFERRGIFAHGEEVTSFGLVKKSAGGQAVPANERPVMEEVELEEAVQEAWVNWIKIYTNLEFRTDGKVRRASLEEQTAGDQAMALSARSLTSGAGHAQPGTTVENDLVNGGGELYVEPTDPQGGGRALTKIPLQRPRKPVLGGGHTKPGTNVDKDLTSGSDDGELYGELYVEPASPTGGRRAGEKIELQRPKPRRDHVLVHKR